MTRNKFKLREKGFTFIELILVVLLISILSTIAVLNYSELQKQTTTDLVRTDLNVLRAAVRAYYMKNQSYPDTSNVWTVLSDSNYIEDVPKDKFSPTQNYCYSKGTSTTDCKIWSRGPNGIDDGGINDGGAKDDITISFSP